MDEALKSLIHVGKLQQKPSAILIHFMLWITFIVNGILLETAIRFWFASRNSHFWYTESVTAKFCLCLFPSRLVELIATRVLCLRLIFGQVDCLSESDGQFSHQNKSQENCQEDGHHYDFGNLNV
jgi:hypothetical protein